MVKTVLSFIAAVLMLGTLASCMDDPITTYEPDPQNIFRPNSVGFRFLEHTAGSPTGSIRVYWSNSSSDVQPNFAGYVVRLLAFDSVIGPGGLNLPKKARVLQQKVVDKLTFEAIFDNVPIDSAYAVAVWGRRNPSTSNADSLVLSRDSMAKEIKKFDPRPLTNPTAIRAASLSSSVVLLTWDLPSDTGQGNLYSYTVYYRNPAILNDSAKYIGEVLASSSIRNSLELNVPVTDDLVKIKEYEFWVKAVRSDSTQFYDDSTLIRWSGGELVSLDSSIRSGDAMALGRDQQNRYLSIKVAPTDDRARIQFEREGDDLVLRGLNNTRFMSVYHGSIRLDTAVFSAPVPESEFDQSTIRVPVEASQGGWIVYARLFGQQSEPVRLLLRSVVGTSLIAQDGHLVGEMIFQPAPSDQIPPLPYF